MTFQLMRRLRLETRHRRSRYVRARRLMALTFNTAAGRDTLSVEAPGDREVINRSPLPSSWFRLADLNGKRNLFRVLTNEALCSLEWMMAITRLALSLNARMAS